MIKNSKIIVLVLFLLFMISNLYSVNALDTSDYYRLPVFETSDIHGYIAHKNENNYEYILAYISDKVKDIRGYDNYRKEMAILLDGGDIYQGYMMSNLLNGDSISTAYKIMDYDAVSLGNHEFDWEINNTVDNDATMKDSNLLNYEMINDIPVVASNLFYNTKKVEFTNDYVIINKIAKNSNGEEINVRIGVIGYLGNYTKSILPSLFSSKGYSIKDDLSIPEKIAIKLENENLVDATILLCHYDSQVIAKKLSKNTAIDIVLGGHSHSNENGVTKDGVLYLQPESYGKSYSYFELVFKKDKTKNVFDHIDKMENKSVEDNIDKTLKNKNNKNELDNEIVELTDNVINSLENELNSKIGYIKVSAVTNKTISGSNKLSTSGGNWASSIYKRGVNADVAFVNRDGVRYNYIITSKENKREITLGDIYSTYPFNNRIYKYEITYLDLLELLNYGLHDSNKSFITSIVGIDCYYLKKEVFALVKDGTIIYKNNKWLDDYENKTLTVATNEYVGSTDKIFSEIHNPMVKWNDSSKLIEIGKTDSEIVIDVLKNEANENNGYLKIDTIAHFRDINLIRKLLNPFSNEKKDNIINISNNNYSYFIISFLMFLVLILTIIIIKKHINR